jgi:hypothetical protein
MCAHNAHPAFDQALLQGELSNAIASDATPLEDIADETQYESYHPYTFSYGSPGNTEAFNRPLIFAPPLPDLNNFDDQDEDQDSTFSDPTSVRSVLVDDSGYQWRHEHGRRYHGRFEGLRSDYHLPNGMPIDCSFGTRHS